MFARLHHGMQMERICRHTAVWMALILSVHFSRCAAEGPYTPTSAFRSTPCNLTFGAFDAAFFGSAWFPGVRRPHVNTLNYTIPLLPFLSIAALCPSDCVRAADSGRVYGSYPYDGRSSICLAAIHSGIIDASAGGGVFVSRFWRHDWSNSSTQTVFPYNSSSGSLSNGVQSEPVDASWYTVPSSANEWSYVTRGRGDRMLQRRTAPFPKRAGHLQLMFQWTSPPGRADSGTQYLLHLVAAGYNSTHYLNDVWLGVQRGRENASDVSWSRQADAPFTPRSHMQVRAEDYLNSYVVGGQTNHSCGLRELGVCSGEVWRFRLTPDNREPEPIWQVSWDPEPLLHLPFTPRCQPAMLVSKFIRSQGPPVDGLIFVGGQLSFEASQPCSDQPETVSEFWFGNFTLEAASQARWWRLPDVPFSRRFEWSNPQPYWWVQMGGEDFFTETGERGALIGGLRHVSTRLVSPGVAQLNQTEITAELLRCLVGNGMGPGAPPLPYLLEGVGAAMAAPTAASVNYGTNDDDLSFGGIISDGFIRAWRNALPPLDADIRTNYSELAINITLVRGVPHFPSFSHPDFDPPIRAGLPLNLTMNAAELADPNGNYALGSEWTQSLPFTGFTVTTPVSTFHHQPFAFAAVPREASWFVPQAASSTNTTRPLFNFSLRRHSHRYARLANSFFFPCGEIDACSVYYFVGVSSGGSSGDHYFDDWISTNQIKCLPPVDPSYREVLGPIRIVEMDGDNRSTVLYYAGSAHPGFWSAGNGILVYCPLGYHFEPPLMDSEARLHCVPNGMWMDVDALTIRRCVANVLNCTLPLGDVGSFDCEPALPVINRVSAAAVEDSDRGQSFITNLDNVTVVGVPVGTSVQLTIDGNVFVHPVAVFVDGKQCEEPTLLIPGGGAGNVCYNLSSEGDGPHNVTVQRRCDDYGSRITCKLPPLLGRKMAVTVSSGRLGAVAEVDPDIGCDVATLTSMAPVITSITATDGDCLHDDNLLQLTDCPVNRSFHVDLCALYISVGESQDVVAIMSGNSYYYPLDCSNWVRSNSRVCMTCRVFPRLTKSSIFLRHTTIVLDETIGVPLSFQQCPAGSSINLTAVLQGSASDICSQCPVGWSTDNNSGQSACIPCPAGHYSDTSGAATCSVCPAGTYAGYSNSTACLPCSPNSYAGDSAQTRCSACELNQYIVYAPQQALIAGDCRDCPAMTKCDSLGNITAQAGAYVLIDQSAGTISTTTCWSSACLDGHQCADSSSAQQPLHVALSNLTVINCCAPGGWPAYVADPELYRYDAVMQATNGHNVLCASCLAGFVSVNGRCIECSSTRVGPLVGVLLLALLLVYLVHRLPHDWTGSAALLITSYFVQMSALFQATEALPQLFSLLNVNLLGSHVSRGGNTAIDISQRTIGYAGVCIVPLSDSGRMTTALLSPLMAFVLLAVVAVLQYAARAALSRNQVPPSAAAYRVYSWLFVPSQPRLFEPGDRPSVSRYSGQQQSLAISLLQEPSPTALDNSASLSASSDEFQEAESGRLLPLSYQRTCVRLVQLSYCGLTLVTLSFFHLQSVGEFGWRVMEYPTMSPESAEYRTMLPFVIAVLAIVVCGIPLALTGFLFVEHRRGSIEKVKLQQRAGRMDSSRKAALLLQLCAAFGQQYWWMAPSLLLRRLLLVALLVSVRGSDVWAWLTLVNYCLLAVHLKLEPYERSQDNTMEGLTLLSLSVQTTLLMVWPPPYLSPAVLAVLNTLIIAPLLPFLVNVFGRLWRRHRIAAQSLGQGIPQDNSL